MFDLRGGSRHLAKWNHCWHLSHSTASLLVPYSWHLQQIPPWLSSSWDRDFGLPFPTPLLSGPTAEVDASPSFPSLVGGTVDFTFFGGRPIFRPPLSRLFLSAGGVFGCSGWSLLSRRGFFPCKRRRLRPSVGFSSLAATSESSSDGAHPEHSHFIPTKTKNQDLLCTTRAKRSFDESQEQFRPLIWSDVNYVREGPTLQW